MPRKTSSVSGKRSDVISVNYESVTFRDSDLKMVGTSARSRSSATASHLGSSVSGSGKIRNLHRKKRGNRKLNVADAGLQAFLLNQQASVSQSGVHGGPGFQILDAISESGSVGQSAVE